MAKPGRKTAAAETGLVGVGIAVLVEGVRATASDPAGGAIMVAVGLLLLGVGVYYRNLQVSVDDEEVVAAVERNADKIVSSLGGGDANGGDARGNSSTNGGEQ